MSGVELVLAVLPLAYAAGKYLTSSGYKYRSNRFGRELGTILYATDLLDTDAVQQMHWDLNAWSDEEVLRWRDSQLASANAIAVAVSSLSSH